jgi:phage-related protein
VKLKSAVYVLHAFMKKSKSGIATPKPDIDLIRARLRDAEALDKVATEVAAKTRKDG